MMINMKVTTLKLILLFVSLTNGNECPENEEFDVCGTACEPSCDNPSPQMCTEQCVSKCFCKEGFLRDLSSNKCVKPENCTCTFPNTEFQECGNDCPNCQNANPLHCFIRCKPGCYCKHETWRDTNTGQCVAPEKCTCANPDEEFNTCGTACQKTCQDPNPACTKQCVPGCFCKDINKVRDEDGRCVSLDECECPPNEYPSEDCAPCSKTCDDPYEDCDDLCPAGCFCVEGTYRNAQGECVPLEKCTCSHPNEEFRNDTCVQPTCQEPYPQTNNHYLPACYCKPGYIRDTCTDKCVTRDQCTCPENEEFTCSNPCLRSCTPYRICPLYCREGCFCKHGYVRQEYTNKCVKCSCGENEELACKTDSEPTCQNPNPSEFNSEECLEKCYCKTGYVRNDFTHKCVEKESCQCGENEVYDNRKTCEATTCEATDPAICSETYIAKCYCKDGYYRNAKTNTCQPCCVDKYHEIFDYCAGICEPTCQDPDKREYCKSCSPGCVCQEGFIINENTKECIKKEDCDDVKK